MTNLTEPKQPDPIHSIQIPEHYLLTLAVYGNMGDGHLPKIMQIWAENECRRLGILEKLKAMQVERTRELETRLRNVLGDQVVNQLSSEIQKAVDKLKGKP